MSAPPRRGGQALAVVGLLVLTAIWSSFQLYAGILVPSLQREARGESAQWRHDSSQPRIESLQLAAASASLGLGGSRSAVMARSKHKLRNERCAELVAGGCDDAASAAPAECLPLCRSSQGAAANAGAGTEPLARDGVGSKGAAGAPVIRESAPTSDASGTAAAAMPLPLASASATATPSTTASFSRGAASSATAAAAEAATAAALVSATNASGGCSALVPQGRCFDEPRHMFITQPCAALCSAHLGLPREATQLWTAPPSCFARGAPALSRAPRPRQPQLDTRGYFQLVGGREQMNKNRYLVLDALFYAKALNRTFVEPAVRNSRIARPPPALPPLPDDEAGPPSAEALAAAARADALAEAAAIVRSGAYAGYMAQALPADDRASDAGRNLDAGRNSDAGRNRDSDTGRTRGMERGGPSLAPPAADVPGTLLLAVRAAQATPRVGSRGASFQNVTLGFGSYWEMRAVCRMHRTIDLLAFNRIRVRRAGGMKAWVRTTRGGLYASHATRATRARARE
jgi:hypothetical protein